MRVPFIGLFAVLLGCGAGAQSGPVTTEPEREPAAPIEQEAPAPELMRNHFTDVARARDAVIRGDIEATREPLLRVADTVYGVDLPIGWVSWVDEMQREARAAADARGIAEAGRDVARLARTCGDCHRTTNAGPSLEQLHEESSAAPPEDGPPMARHAWAAGQLWLGLTIPSRAPWVRGAEAIAMESVPAGEAGDQGTIDAEQMAALRVLADRALDASHPGEKATLYGQLLASCAGCHRQLADDSITEPVDVP